MAGALDGMCASLGPVARAGGPAVHADAGRPRRRRDQGRAAGRRRDAPARPAVRRGGRRGLFLARSTAASARSRSTSRSRTAARCSSGCSQRADVLIENFLPGTMERWGLDYDDALAARSSAARLLHDLGLRRRRAAGRPAGLRRRAAGDVRPDERQRRAETGPMRVGVPIVDHLTGYIARHRHPDGAVRARAHAAAVSASKRRCSTPA